MPSSVPPMFADDRSSGSGASENAVPRDGTRSDREEPKPPASFEDARRSAG